MVVLIMMDNPLFKSFSPFSSPSRSEKRRGVDMSGAHGVSLALESALRRTIGSSYPPSSALLQRAVICRRHSLHNTYIYRGETAHLLGEPMSGRGSVD